MKVDISYVGFLKRFVKKGLGFSFELQMLGAIRGLASLKSFESFPVI